MKLIFVTLAAIVGITTANQLYIQPSSYSTNQIIAGYNFEPEIINQEQEYAQERIGSPDKSQYDAPSSYSVPSAAIGTSYSVSAPSGVNTYEIPAPNLEGAESQLSYNNAPVSTSYDYKQPADVAPVYTGAKIDGIDSVDTANTAQVAAVAEERDSSVVPVYNEPVQQTYDAPAPAPAQTSYEAGETVSTGNLYYYYYPVAAQPLYPPSPAPSYNNNHRYGQSKDKYSVRDDSYLGSTDSSSLSSLAVPAIVLLLAIPLVAFAAGSVTTGRAFSDDTTTVDDKFGTIDDFKTAVDKALVTYVTALDTDQCMDRTVCELGTKASELPHKDYIFRLVSWLAPKSHAVFGSNRFAVFELAARDNYTMDTCRNTFVCNPPEALKNAEEKVKNDEDARMFF